MSKRAANCPNCGARIEFLWSSAVQTTCAYCRSILVRHDVDLAKVGQVADLPPDPSPIQIGTEGRYGARGFLVVGRILYEYEGGGWNEWHLVLGDGTSGWLSDAQAEYAVTFQAPLPPDVPRPDQCRPGRQLWVDYVEYRVGTVTRARYRGVQGELPFEYWDKDEVTFVDLRSHEGKFGTLDFSGEPPLLFLGEYVDFDALRLRNLREFEGW